MDFNEPERALLEQWMEDQSFVNWAKQSDEQDIAKWENHFNIHLEQWELAKIGRMLVLGIPFEKISIDRTKGQRALAQLMNRLENGAGEEKPQQIVKIIRLPKFRWIAASIAALVLAFGAIYFSFLHNPEVLLATEYGQQLETTLPDGSVVILNAHSTLRFKKQSSRNVHLEGEAFFEVEKKPKTKAPFRVFTNDLTVTVLGTSFNVNARNDQTKVFLEEGKINLKVADPQAEIIEMNPGDLITYSKKQNKIKENSNNVSALENASWKKGTLIFNDTPLTKALYEIEDIYGIQFVYQTDDLKQQTISGGVPIKDLEVTLQTLTEVYGIQILEQGKRYFISGLNE